MIAFPPLALDELRLPWIRLDCHVCRATGFLEFVVVTPVSVRRETYEHKSERCWRCEGWGVIASRRVGPKQDAVTCSTGCMMHVCRESWNAPAAPSVDRP